MVSGSSYKSTVKATVEGSGISVGNSANSYTIGSVTVEVADGQLTIAFDSTNVSRLDAIIVRQVAAGEDPSEPTDPTDPEETTPEETTPEESTPEETTPEESTPEETTPEESTPEGTTPEETPAETNPDDDSADTSDGMPPVTIFLGAMCVALLAGGSIVVCRRKENTED